VNCNYLKPSIERAGIDLDNYEGKSTVDIGLGGANAWKDIWGTGHGVSGIKGVKPMAELVDQLKQEYRQTTEKPSFYVTK